MLDGRRPSARASASPRTFPSSSARRGSPSPAAASSIRGRSTTTARMAAIEGLERALRARRRRRSSRRWSSRACAAAAAPASRPASSGGPSPQTPAAAEIHRLQRRRGRQRHLRRPHDDGGRSLRADRGHGDRRHRRRRDQGLRLHPLRISARRSRRWSARSRSRAARGLLGAAVAARLMPSTSRCGSAPAPMSAARRPRCSRASRASAARCAPSRRCRRTRACSASRPSSTTCSRFAAVPFILAEGAEAYARLRHGPLARHDADPARRQHQARRPVRDRLRHHAGRAGRRHRRRHRDRPAGARGAGRRAARRLFPARAVRHAVRLRGLRRRATA